MVKRALFIALLACLSLPLAGAEKYAISSGTTFHCRLTQTLTTQLNFQGDPYTATVSEPLVIDGQEVIPVGATLEGRIARMQRPGRIKGVGEMRLTAEKITFPDGRSFPVNAILIDAHGASGAKVAGEDGRVKGPSSRIADLEEIGAGVAAGGVLGTIFGGFHGTVVGGVVGGTVGALDRLRRRGAELTLPSGTQVSYQLTRSLEVYRDERPKTFSRRAEPEGDRFGDN